MPVEVLECVREMSACYNVPAPRVLIGDEYFRSAPRNWIAYYDDETRTIFLRPNRLEERTVVHEMAHHLQTVLGLPDEHGARGFEEVAECNVCSHVLPTPQIGEGAKALCPWCNSLYEYKPASDERLEPCSLTPKEDEVCIPTQEEIYNCMLRFESHKQMVADGQTGAIRFQRILEACYPGDKDRQFDLWCAIMAVSDWRKLMGERIIPLGVIIRSFKKWDVEDALNCDRLKEIFGALYEYKPASGGTKPNLFHLAIGSAIFMGGVALWHFGRK